MSLASDAKAAFAYGDGVGTYSADAIISFAKGSGISLTVTQTNPPGSGGFHGTGNAVDFSNGGDAGTPQMDQFAAWWLSYAPYLLELIHVNQDGSGTYVKYGQVVDSSFYSSVLEQHHNHVHVAATNHGILAARAGGSAFAAQGLAAGESGAGNSGGSQPVQAQTAGLTNPITDVSNLYKFVTDPHNWERLAMFIGGGALLFLAVRTIGEQA